MQIRRYIYCATIALSLAISTRGDAEGGGYESDQGTTIFGVRDPNLEGVVFSYHPFTGTELRIEAGALRQRVAGAETAVKNLILDVGPPPASVKLEIKELYPHKNIYSLATSAQVEEYEVLVIGGASPGPLCAVTNRALVVPGRWIGRQYSNSQPDQGFVFACVPFRPAKLSSKPAEPVAGAATQESRHTSSQQKPITPPPTADLSSSILTMAPTHGGAAAKCIDYGYAPWPTSDKASSQATAADAGSYFNLCIHAMTADYAGDGRSHTISGTALIMFDLAKLPTATCVRKSSTLISCDESSARHIPARRAVQPSARNRLAGALLEAWSVEIPAPHVSDSELLLESVWREDDHGIARALCLSKARWLTIDAMLASFQDMPSAEPSEKRPSCDDWTLNLLSGDRPLIVTYSAMNERGLWRFPYGMGWLTTSRVRWGNQGPEPDVGLPCAKPCIGVFEGLLLSREAMRPSALLGKAYPLYLYENKSHQYATATESYAKEGGHLKGYERVPLSSQRPQLIVEYHPKRKLESTQFRTPSGTAVGTHAPDPVVPEGFLYWTAPTLPPSISPLETGPGTRKLEIWTFGEVYGTTAHPDENEWHNNSPRAKLGVLLFPSEDIPGPSLPPLRVRETVPRTDHGRPPDSVRVQPIETSRSAAPIVQTPQKAAQPARP